MRRFVRQWAALLAVSLAVYGTAAAQEERPPDPKPPDARASEKRRFAMAGTWELGGSASFQRSVPVANGVEDDVNYTLSAYPYAGWFLLDGLELGVNPLGVAMSRSEGTTVVDMRFLFAPSWNFRMRGEWFPFLEGLVGYTARVTSDDQGDATDDGITWGGRVGVKFRVVEHGLLTVGVQYLEVTLDPSDARNRYGSNDIAAAIGFSVWL